MSVHDHLLPMLATLLIWFASTALIMWLANRPRATHRASLAMTAFGAVIGVLVVIAAADRAGAAAAYASFCGGLAIWGWHELAFLSGAVTGPRRVPASAEATGRRRFAEATAAVIHHEVALAATLLLLVVVSWGAVTMTGAAAFALLFALRLSSKLNIHVGVPNLSDDLLPAHLAYLKSYFCRRALTPLLALSVAATIALALWLGLRALAAPAGGEAVGATLLATLAALGALEHLFLALPVRDGALWRWTIPARTEIV